MDAEFERIWRMFGALSDESWRRGSQPGVSILDVRDKQADGPVGEVEEAIWNELTAPDNYAALVRYVESWKQRGVNEHASRQFDSVLARAKCRLDAAAKTQLDNVPECDKVATG
jgi:hypothetical protein